MDALASSYLLLLAHGSTGPVKGDDYRDPLQEFFDKGIEALLDLKQAPLEGLTVLGTTTDDARPANHALSK